MLFWHPHSVTAVTTPHPVSPLNGVWLAPVTERVTLPHLGHLSFIVPLADTAVTCHNLTLSSRQYALLRPARHALALEPAAPAAAARVLILLLSPGFIRDMADFLNIPHHLNRLLDGVPLLQGDPLSQACAALARQQPAAADPAQTEALLLEAVGQLLHLMRLRQQALTRLTGHKRRTLDDWLPRLLQARQFIEARYRQPLKTRDVARHVALSEYHFARLFKAAFDVTVRQYVIRLRLDAARRRLQTPGATVTETALAVGYGSLSAFIHAFRARFGLSPARYQAHCLAKSSRI